MNSETQYVVDIMTPSPVVVGPEMVAWSADHLAQQRGVHHLLVIDQYRLVGVVCGCDLHRAGTSVHVGDCMQRHPMTIDDQQTVDAAAERMEADGVGCLPVLDWSGALRGVVTRHDLRAVGVLSGRHATCASCGSTHGLDSHSRDEPVSFCFQCREQGQKPRTAIDAAYFTLGGGD
jgi:signal-transduction protein with cAMP-binding, CBS, and nucleotidyltransferase domain